MKVIAFAARKGGSGKTTLTAHLAVEAAKKQPVTLVDTDPQHGLTDWWKSREAEYPLLLDLPLSDLARDLVRVANSPGVLMIDSPPSDSSVIEAIIGMADLIVIPVKPSPNDLRGVAWTVDMAKATGKRFIFVLNQAIARANITDEAKAALSKFGPVAPTIVFNRAIYAASMTDGRVAQEIDGSGKASSEIASLWKTVSKQISK